jgi:hypothetical protein
MVGQLVTRKGRIVRKINSLLSGVIRGIEKIDTPRAGPMDLHDSFFLREYVHRHSNGHDRDAARRVGPGFGGIEFVSDSQVLSIGKFRRLERFAVHRERKNIWPGVVAADVQ